MKAYRGKADSSLAGKRSLRMTMRVRRILPSQITLFSLISPT